MKTLSEKLKSWGRRANPYSTVVAARVNGDLVFHEILEGSVFPIGVADPTGLRFPIYSITKPITAVCALRMQAAGLLDIRERVERWFPELNFPQSMKVEHLLRHTSGVPDYGPVKNYHDDVRRNPSFPWGDAQFLGVIKHCGQLFTPGDGWAYSNTGYMLLRLIIERVSTLSFGEILRRYLTIPLGLTDTFIAESMSDWSTCVPGFGSEVDPNCQLRDVREFYHPGWVAPGVAISTAEDLTQFFDGLFAGEILDETSLKAMLKLTRVPHEHPPAVTPSYGMGIMADPDSPVGATYGHGGRGPGYSLSCVIVPDSRIGRLTVAVFCNASDGAEPDQLASTLIAHLVN